MLRRCCIRVVGLIKRSFLSCNACAIYVLCSAQCSAVMLLLLLLCDAVVQRVTVRCLIISMPFSNAESGIPYGI
jgi:hypothetical protein